MRTGPLMHICIYGFNYEKLPKHFQAKPSSVWCLHTNRLFLSFSPLYQAPFQAFSGPGCHIVNRNWSLHSSTWNLFLSPLPDGCCLALLVSDLRNACSDLLNQKCSSLWIKNSLLEILFHTHAVFLGLWNICSLWNIWMALFSAVEIFLPLLLTSMFTGRLQSGWRVVLYVRCVCVRA